MKLTSRFFLLILFVFFAIPASYFLLSLVSTSRLTSSYLSVGAFIIEEHFSTWSVCAARQALLSGLKNPVFTLSGFAQSPVGRKLFRETIIESGVCFSLPRTWRKKDAVIQATHTFDTWKHLGLDIACTMASYGSFQSRFRIIRECDNKRLY